MSEEPCLSRAPASPGRHILGMRVDATSYADAVSRAAP